MRLTRDTSLTPSVLLHQRLSRRWSTLVVIGLLTLIFLVDRSTGSSPFQHLYYLPIIFAGVQFRYRGSLVVAATAIALYHLANWHVLSLRYEERDIVQVALFLAVGLVAAKMAADARRLHQLAMTDDLTGLRNLRSFEGQLRTLVAESIKQSSPLALLILDLDRLKSLNDAYGHLTGGEAVRTVGQLIAQQLPREAVACRYGGDEFAIVLPGYTDADAGAFANHLRAVVHTCKPTLAGVSFPPGTLSVSVGIAVRPSPPTPETVVQDPVVLGERLFQAADVALYAAKRAGRNRVSIGHPAA